MTADEKVKITDFGIAKIASSNLTTTGQFLGTPNYMSPEQVSGSPVDGRSDIFSLGVVLYELLTRRKPFSGENLTAISYKIVHEDFTPPAELSTDVPPEFNPIVARAMAKDPWNRYQRGKDFALALQQLRAHLEEQRAMADLGTMVSASDDVATAKMENLAEIAAEGARQAEASGTRRPAPTPGAPPASPAAAESSGSRPFSVRPEPPIAAPPAPPAAAEPPKAVSADIRAQDAATRRRVGTERLRPRLFWGIAIGAAAAGVASLVRGPEQAVTELRRDLDEGKKLYAAGRYQEALAVFRNVLAKDANSRAAQQYVQMSETALRGRQEETRKSSETEKAMQMAQAAAAEGNFEEAKKQAEAVLEHAARSLGGPEAA